MKAYPARVGKIHFCGIGGIGMSGIAEILHDMDYKIQGSDTNTNNNVKRLQKKGIDTTHYREVETCKRVRSQMVPIKPIFDHYCLPELARVLP